MSKYRDAMALNMRAQLPKALPAPVVDLGGRGHRPWMQEIIGPNFETWDMIAGKDVTRVVDATRMAGIEQASVGTFISTSAFEHIDKPWAAAALMARVQRPGGLLYVCAPFEFAFHEQPKDYWRFTPDALRVLFGPNYDELSCDWANDARLAVYYLGSRKPGAVSEADAIAVALGIHGLITEEELHFLYQQSITAPKGGEYVELGTFQGRSCSVLCHAAGLRGQIPWTIDDYSYMAPSSPELVGKHLRAVGLQARILQGDSKAPPKEIGPVGCLFIDSLHLAVQIAAEYAAWAPKVVPGGIVICHDYQGTKWKEMKDAIDKLFVKGWQRLGTERSMIAFRRTA